MSITMAFTLRCIAKLISWVMMASDLSLTCSYLESQSTKPPLEFTLASTKSCQYPLLMLVSIKYETLPQLTSPGQRDIPRLYGLLVPVIHGMAHVDHYEVEIVLLVGHRRSQGGHRGDVAAHAQLVREIFNLEAHYII
jgi:hypothetical protein